MGPSVFIVFWILASHGEGFIVHEHICVIVMVTTERNGLAGGEL
jgi:hypothetical protein